MKIDFRFLSQSTLLAMAALSLPLWAGGLSTPFENETAAVLPKGIRSPRFKSINTWVENGFDAEGTQHELAYKLNKQILFSDTVKSAATVDEKNQLKGTLDASSIPETASAGQVTGIVNAYVNANVPVFAVGVTDQWTLAAALPVYNVHVAVQTGFVASANTIQLMNKVRELNPVKAFEAEQKLSNPLASKLQQLGYQDLKSEDFSAPGDAKVVSKYCFYKTELDTLTWKMEATLPTGKTAQQDKLIDFPTGDGQTDVGTGLIWDRAFSNGVTWNAFGFYNYQTPDKLDRRIPTSSGDPLSSDIENVQRKLGDQMTVGTSLQYGTSAGGFYTSLGYSYQSMAATHYSGSLFAGTERYQWLEELSPSQELTSMVAQLGYSSIAAYRAKSFAVPLQAHLGYGHPIAGKNTTAADVYMAELVMFF